MQNGWMSTLRSLGASRLLAAVLAVGLPAGSAWAYGDSGQQAYADADARMRAVQFSLNHDQADLGAARLQVDQLQSARDGQLHELSALKQGAVSQSERGRSDLDRVLRDQAKLRDQAQSLQQTLQTTKAKADQIHADALAKFESTDSFKANFAAFDKARQELKPPTDAVLEQLAQTREFQDRVAAARAAKANESKLRQGKADPKAIAAAEEEFVKADNQVQDMEEKALTSDPTVMAGRRKVDDAQGLLRQMRDLMEQDLQKSPAFAGMLEDLQKQQASLEAVMADQRKVDSQVADSQSGVDRAPQAAPVNTEALSDAEAKLNSINADLDRAQQQIARLEARLATDQQSLAEARRDRDAIAQDLESASVASPQDYPQYAPAYSTYPTPVYSTPTYYSDPPVDYYPAYAPGWDSGAYLSLGFRDSWYSDPYYYDSYRGRGHYYDRDRDSDRDRDRGYHGGYRGDRGHDRSDSRGSYRGSSYSGYTGGRYGSGSATYHGGNRSFSGSSSSRGYVSNGGTYRSSGSARASSAAQRSPSYYARSGGYESHSAQRSSSGTSGRYQGSPSGSGSRGGGSGSGSSSRYR